jgi:hypothetical protein
VGERCPFFFGETRDAEDEKQEGEAWRYIWRTDGRKDGDEERRKKTGQSLAPR